MPVPLPLVAIERASGSVSETCPSGASRSCCPICFRCSMCALTVATFSLSRETLPSVTRVGCRFRPVELGQITAYAFLQLRHALLELVVGEVLVPIVDRFELAAIDGNDRVREQIEPAAQHNEFATDVTDRLTVVLAEVSDGLEVRRQAPGQPHQLNVALGLAFQAPTRLQTIEIPVDVDLQQHRRVVRWTPGVRRRHTVETKTGQIQFVDEDINH